MNVKDIGPREGHASLPPHLLRSADAEPLATTRVFFDVFRLPPVSVKVEFAENLFISDFGFAIAITQCERYLRVLWSLPQCGVSSHRNTRKTTDEKRNEPESEKLLLNNLHLSHTADTSHESCSN